MTGQRADVRRMLVLRGWDEPSYGLVKHNGVSVSWLGSDVFVTGPARGQARNGRDTCTFPAGVPARAIAALCVAWADRKAVQS